jgi:TATA-binding protein-associated factor
VKALHSFLDGHDLRKDWIDSRVMRLLYQNLVLEERSDVRAVTYQAWQAALRAAEKTSAVMDSHVLPHFVGWFSIALTPMNGPLPASLFYHVRQGSTEGRYDVDKSMMAGDLSLLSLDAVVRNRIEAVAALAQISCEAQSPVSSV